MNYVPRWYQQAAEDALNQFFIDTPPRVDAEGKPMWRNPLVCMPTGTGKSLAIGSFIANAVRRFPTTKAVMLTHVKELIEQNAKALLTVWPQAPLGIYSAGLKRKEIHAQIIYAGIASIKDQAARLGYVDMVIIDECHLLSPNNTSMYQAFLSELRERNPWLVVIGFTATPYRLGIGSLTNNGIFTHTAFDLTSLDMFNRLVHEGWIAPLTVKKGRALIDISNVDLGSNGDYKTADIQKAADNTPLTDAIVRDILENGAGRRSCLIFASGVEHAEHMSECFAHYGYNLPAVHSKMDATKRDDIIADFKAGRYWGVINNNILTTGFDHPPVDLIGMVRPTTSTGLWVQMLGRGTRPSHETFKSDCLVLDYAGNTPRLGPINDPNIPRMKGKGAGQAPVWECPACGKYNHARAMACIYCGEPHDMTGNLDANASIAEVMVSEIPVVDTFTVSRVLYYKHEKEGKPDSLRVMYVCGLRSFTEWVTLEHAEPAASRARGWWRDRFMGEQEEVPATTAEALQLVSYLKEPVRVRVWTNTKFPKIMGVEF